MSPVLLTALVMVVGGGLACVAARDPRVSVVGLAAVVAASPFLADPLPDPAPLAARLVAAGLVGEVLWVAARGLPRAGGAQPGWPTRAWLAGAAVLAGLGLAASGPGAIATSMALAGSFGLLALSLPSLVQVRPAGRPAVDLLLPLVAAVLLCQAVGPPISALEQVLVAVIEVAAACAIGLAGADR